MKSRIEKDEPLLFSQLADAILEKHKVPVGAGTLYRWAKDGLNGIFLECKKVGARRFSSMQAYERFVKATATISRLKLSKAAEILGCSIDHVKNLIARGIFTAPQQDCEGGDRFIHADEVEFWLECHGTAEERKERIRDFRIRLRRLKPMRMMA